jgi:hypothetical protein
MPAGKMNFGRMDSPLAYTARAKKHAPPKQASRFFELVRRMWLCSEGTFENSPAFQRRVHVKTALSPAGTADKQPHVCPAVPAEVVTN